MSFTFQRIVYRYYVVSLKTWINVLHICKAISRSEIVFSVFVFVLLPACSTIDDLLGAPGNNIPPGTEEPGVVKFIALGDTGHGNVTQKKVASAMKKKCEESGCDFVLLLGDNIYPNGVESPEDTQFQKKFENPYKEIGVPFYVVLGNHDYGADGFGLDAVKSLHQVRYTQHSSKWVMPSHFYQFMKAEVSFFAFDTNAQMFDLANDQKVAIRKWIGSSKARWKVAYGHHPYKSNGPHGNAGEYDDLSNPPISNGTFIKSFAENIWCGKVDVYLSGHDHSRQWLDGSCNGSSLIVSGAGSNTTSLKGSNPVLFQSDKPGFLYVKIEGNSLRGEFYDAQGNMDFSHIMVK